MPLFKPNVKKLEAKRNVDGLIKALDHTDYLVRDGAALALCRIGDPRAVQPLIDVLGSANNVTQERIVSALQHIGEPAVEPLIPMLKGNDDRMRMFAAEILGEIGGEQVVQALIPLLMDNDSQERHHAEEALINIGRPTVTVEHLVPLLKHPQHGVRTSAVRILKRIGWRPRKGAEKAQLWIYEGKYDDCAKLGKSAVEPLITALGDKRVHYFAAEALGKIGDTHAVEPLIAALGDEYWRMRYAAAEALGRIGDARAIEPLVATLGDDHDDVRKVAAEALAKLGWASGSDRERARQLFAKRNWLDLESLGEPAVEVILAEVEKYLAGDYDLPSQAVWTLGGIGDRRAVSPLLRVLKQTTPDTYIGEEAIEALGRIGDKRCTGELVDYLFANPKSSSKQNKENYSEYFRALENLFGAHTQPILKLAGQGPYVHSIGLGRADKALEELCVDASPIANNILHRVIEKRDYDVPTHFNVYGGVVNTKRINFEHLRKTASEELKRRGNPPYTPSAYYSSESDEETQPTAIRRSPPETRVESDVFQKMRSIIAGLLVIDEAQVTSQARLEVLGADYLDIVEIFVSAEKQFGIKLSDEDIQGVSTVGEAVRCVETAISQKGHG